MFPGAAEPQLEMERPVPSALVRPWRRQRAALKKKRSALRIGLRLNDRETLRLKYLI
jgi:hypothetical protein